MTAAERYRIRHLGADTAWCFDRGDEELLGAVRGWLDAGTCDRGERQGVAPVWLTDEWAIKLHGRPDKRGRAWRRSRLRRAAFAHFALASLITPAPLVVVERRRHGRLVAAGMVMERLRGLPLEQVWHESAARRALPPVLAELLAGGAVHGDIHPGNLLWDGRRWAVIDLDSMRQGLHRLVRRRAWHRVFGGLHFKLRAAPGLKACHAATCDLVGHGDVDRRWRGALGHSRRMAHRRGLPALPEEAAGEAG